MDRLITTLGTKNKQKLRQEFGFKSIRQAKKELGVDTDAEAYEIMQDSYNQAIEEFRRQDKQQKNEKIVQNVTILRNGDEIHQTMKNFTNESIIIQMKDNGRVIKNIHVDIPANFNNWWRTEGFHTFYYGTDTEFDQFFHHYPNGVVYVWRQNLNITPQMVKQHFKEGNVNCLLNPIKLWAEDKLFNSKSKSSITRYTTVVNNVNKFITKYDETGVDETIINDIAHKLQLDISIEKPLCDIKYIDAKSNKKALKHFKFLNTKCDHVELNELVNESDYTTVSREEMAEIADKLDYDNVFFHYKRDNVGYRQITTLKGVYKLSNDFYDKCNEFEKSNGLNFCKVDDVNDKELSNFIQNGTHYNGTVDFKNIKNIDKDRLNHMDMEKAYTQSELCKFYEGYLGKITDFRKCNKINGVGLYQITELTIPEGNFKKLNNKMVMYLSNNIYTSAELKMLENYGCSFKIICGAWGRKPLTNINLKEDFLLEKYDKVSGYAKYVGMCDMHHLEKKTYMKGSQSMFNLLQKNTNGNVSLFHNNEICVSYPKSSNLHLGHFTSFITAYQRMNVIEQLMNMNYNNLIRVCVDGIYYYGEEKCYNAFRYQIKLKIGNEPGDTYMSNISRSIKDFCVSDYKSGEYRDYHGTELHIGEGGNGKTHMNLMDKGLVRPLYVAPSWKLSSKKHEEYGIRNNVWANICSEDPIKINIIKKYYNCIIIDEVSQMCETQKEFILETYDDMKLIFCGDVGFQTPCFTIGEIEMNTQGFDKVIEHHKNYRFKCQLLINLIKDVRLMIWYGRPDYEINKLVKDYLKNKTIDHTQLKEMYKIDDMILTRTHNIKDEYTEMFNDMQKWYVKVNDRVYKNGQIVIGNKPETSCVLQHAYTIHSIQGETAKHKLFIDATKQYEGRTLYTAISRATRLEQIYLVYDEESAEKYKKSAEDKKKANYKAHWSQERCDGCRKKVVYCKC